MSEDDLFTPSEKDARGDAISPAALEWYGDITVLDPAWERLDTAATAEQFYRAAAKLVFHARHLHPTCHARLAVLLQKPFKRPPHRPSEWQRLEEIIVSLRGLFAIARPTGGVEMTPIIYTSEWAGLSRLKIIAEIEIRYGMTHDAARKVYDAAKREILKRRGSQEAATGNKPAP